MAANPEIRDLIIIGAGPAGLSAATGATSERLDTLVLDAKRRLGGQAGTSSLIENYPGFPEGITGPDLVSSMTDHARKFKTEFMAPARVDNIEAIKEGFRLTEDGTHYMGSTVLLACGVDYNKLKASNVAAYLGRGVNYGSPQMTVPYDQKKVYIVGGANSAGQAAMHLSEFSECYVTMLVRGPSIEEKMSGYLIDKIKATPNIKIQTDAKLKSVNGNGCLEEITIASGDEEKTVPADELFILIGASPRTAWLPKDIRCDNFGFVLSGANLGPEAIGEFEEINNRRPFPHETSMPGIFVAGDARSHTDKRVALAVGDGMAAVPEIHRLRALNS